MISVGKNNGFIHQIIVEITRTKAHAIAPKLMLHSLKKLQEVNIVYYDSENPY